MMINKRLIGTVPGSIRYIWKNVLCQWVGLLCNAAMIGSFGALLQQLISRNFDRGLLLTAAGITLASIVIRFFCMTRASRMSFLASKSVKKTLREKIYQKLLRLGISYTEKVSTSEVVQVSAEGVEQLETYFGSYLPQFFYSMLAPLTLFVILSFVSVKAALILLVCVPLIPVSIAAVQTFAKKLLKRYWGQYTALGDSFLENLQGLTTLKIYQADGYKNEEMNREAEKFRKITMKVLTMQLNSITVMDLIAYGGAALGIILSVTEFLAGRIGFMGCFAIILLSADFFLPLRTLGSYFHIAMNGMAASDKIFRLLDLPEAERKTGVIDPGNCRITCRNVRFSYNEEREILHGVSMEFPQGSFTSIVGESGCGKSTVAAILMGMNKNYTGSVKVGETELSEISEESIMEQITLISHNSYLFRGTVRQNLQMGRPDAPDDAMWKALEEVKLAGFLRAEQGLDTPVLEKASNFSGGQCQRLALARALLHDSPVLVFDEATSNIDVESENDIIALIHSLAKTKTILLISHRLANVVQSDRIYVMQQGEVAQSGSHEQLLQAGGVYRRLWESQRDLEEYRKEDKAG